jgi:ParB-like chromosome segregation protein Spo0J
MNLFGSEIAGRVKTIILELSALPPDARIEAINEIKLALHGVSPFATEPVDCVLWVEAERVTANDYNPNSVAPPEMRLLERSIEADGYTQPIVAWEKEGQFEVVDGFHRNRVGKESPIVRKRIHGYLPLAIIQQDRHDRGDRIAATIRHNRARGKHQVQAMSDIVIELKRRNWSDDKIGKELGMDPDEVLRLTQITGLAEMFADEHFSKSWDIGAVSETELFTPESLLEEEA